MLFVPTVRRKRVRKGRSKIKVFCFGFENHSGNQRAHKKVLCVHSKQKKSFFFPPV